MFILMLPSMKWHTSFRLQNKHSTSLFACQFYITVLKEYKEILIDTTCKYSDIKFIWEGIEQSEQTQDFQKQNQFKLVDTCARDKVFTILFSISWKKQKLLKLFERRRKHAMFGSSASGSKSDCTAHALYGLLFVKQNQMFNSKTRFFVVWF